MSKHEGPSAMVAFVRSSKETGDQRIKTGSEGPILWATGDFLQELEDGCGGWDISDHGIPEPDKGLHGLLLFEGWLDISVGDEPDVNWEGWWRQLSSWELGRMRFGFPPHGEHTPIADDEAKAAEKAKETECKT